jgi:hypothetical protein
MLRLSKLRLLGLRPARRIVSGALDAIDRAVAPCPAIEQCLDEQRPDLIVITPLIGLVASSQLDLLRSALRRRHRDRRDGLELGPSVEQGGHARRA